jgi:hypothetical protein
MDKSIAHSKEFRRPGMADGLPDIHRKQLVSFEDDRLDLNVGVERSLLGVAPIDAPQLSTSISVRWNLFVISVISATSI